MNNQETSENYSSSAAGQKSDSGERNAQNDSRQPHIQPSEPDSGSEENAPGRTAGKAEGSREIVEADLAEKGNQTEK